MNILIFDNENEISTASGSLIASQVTEKPNAVLGLATGSTALIPYKTMIRLYAEKAVSFAGVTSFNLDEYCGLDVHNENSYYSFMHDNLFRHIDICEDNTHFLNGNAENTEAECAAYDKMIEAAGGIDIQLLGIGSDGHIAFNEPCGHFPEGSHIVTLDERTIRDNARFFNSIDEVPTQALTMGIGSIMRARKILLIATGENKAQAVQQMVEGEISPMCPASVLRLHPNATIMLDRAAASLLKK